ncbi:hypothetical protein LG299_11325 [Microbacterium lacus]|uniref:hypothetical protein n=1 Tax=Microbacterium lacus TaxID=415217 RepID=UPI00385083F0
MITRSTASWAAASLVVVLVGLTACASTPSASPSTNAPIPPVGPDMSADDGWIAFSANWESGDIMLVRPDEPAHRIFGADDDGILRVCPAFAPGGTRLAFGEASGDWESGWTDAALVVADVTPEGEATVVGEVALDTLTNPACPIWSPDGRWIAFGAHTAEGTPRLGSPEVWLFDTESGEITAIADLMITDIEWSPDGSELYLADNDGVLIYSMADGTRQLLDGTAAAQSLTVSPDGQTLALERRRINAADRFDLVLLGADGSNQRVIVSDYTQMHGLGPVWSPDGTRIVFQRSCDTTPDGAGGERPCSEEHDVIMITVADESQAMLPRPQVPDNDVEVVTWYPYSVTWSPDSSSLLYLGWPAPDDIEADFEWRDGLAIVSPDAASAPLVLYEGGIPVYIGRPMNVSQSWGASAQ